MEEELLAIVPASRPLSFMDVDELRQYKEKLLDKSYKIQNRIDVLNEQLLVTLPKAVYNTTEKERRLLGKEKKKNDLLLRDVRLEFKNRCDIKKNVPDNIDAFLLAFFNVARNKLDVVVITKLIEEATAKAQNRGNGVNENQNIEVFTGGMA